MNGYALDSDTVSFLLRRQENVRRRLDLMVARNIDIVIPPYVRDTTVAQRDPRHGQAEAV